MVEQLALDVDEYVYGLGEQFTPFVKNGQTVEMWNEDGGTASSIAYKNIPFYISNKGYGVLLDNEGDAAYEIASEKVEAVKWYTGMLKSLLDMGVDCFKTDFGARVKPF